MSGALGTEEIDHNVGWVDYSGTDDPAVGRAVRELGMDLSRFVNSRRAVLGKSSLFERGAYTPPDNIYAEMATARSAMASDDVVSAVAEITEGMAFDGLKFESPNMDETDVFNQIARGVDLDNYVRQVWREEFSASQCVTAAWWDFKTYKVRGSTPAGTRRKKAMTVYAPQNLTILDSTRVVPVGTAFDGQDRLAWHATKAEYTTYQNEADPLMQRYFSAKYKPTEAESSRLAGIGINPTTLLEMSQAVWRHTATKSDWEQFAPVRLRSIFRFLDLKQQLMESDRVTLVGAANYILLVRKGSEKLPASQPEIDNLKENFQIVAKLPVIIGDHRLSIEIITPKLDMVLNQLKYEVLNNAIALRSLGTFHISQTGRSDNSLTIGRAIAKGMENRRSMIARMVQKEIARAVVEHPFNDGLFEEEPELVFIPKQIALDMDAVVGTAVQAMRNTGDLSRMSYLEHFGFDEFVEAQRRKQEKELGFDDLFETHVPFDSPGASAGGQPAKGPGAGGDGGTGQNMNNASKTKTAPVKATSKKATTS
jgi:hypothetical protein